MQINCYLTPHETAGLYSLKLEFPHVGNNFKAEELTDIGNDCEFHFQQKQTKVSHVLGLLDQFNDKAIRSQLDGRGMLDLGVFLYQATLGKYTGDEIHGDAVDLRIISNCEHIHRLPWNLLALEDEYRFLRDADWQITLAHENNTQAIDLPPLPSVLIFSPPEITGIPMTDRDAHIRELKQAITDEIRSYENQALFRVVGSRQELESILQRQHFDILYYYGHGKGDSGSSSLKLEATTPSNPGTMSLMQLRSILSKAAGGPPKLCYINACMSSSGGKMGAGLQLGQTCAAVIANRTEAWISVAQRQGLSVLKHILLDGISPHEALHRTVNSSHEDAGDLSWATPILTSHYTNWHCERPPNLHHLNRQAKDWRTRLDRTKQSGLIGEYIEAVVEGSVDTLCCLWYGSKKSGVDLLHERVTHKVPDTTDLISCQMDWDNEIPNECQQEVFRASLLSSFRCLQQIPPSGIEAIPRFLKEIALHAGSRRILFHLRLQTVRISASGFDWAIPVNFKNFLEWWQQIVSPEFQRAGIAVVITMGYELDALEKLRKQYDKHLKSLNDQQLMVRLLPPLEEIFEDDMRDFIQTFKLPVSPKTIDGELALIRQLTDGDYSRSLDSLINLYEHGIVIPIEKQQDDDEDDFDFS